MAAHYHGLEPLTVKSVLEDSHLKEVPTIGLYLDDQFQVKKDDNYLPQFNFGSAFLGPNLWDKSFDSSDFNLEYMNLDEFLSDHSIQNDSDEAFKKLSEETEGSDSMSQNLNVNSPMLESSSPCSGSPHCLKSCPFSCTGHYQTPTKHPTSQKPFPTVSPFRMDFQVTEHDLAVSSIAGEQGFNPQKRSFTEKELRPQPITKKMKKVFIPNDMKDEKYWTYRLKNNSAAKRSRDIRRTRENQIAMRTAFLEKENLSLQEEMTRLWRENAQLKEKVAHYESPVLSDTDQSV